MATQAENSRGQNTTNWGRRTQFNLRDAVENALILEAELSSEQIGFLVASEMERDALVGIAAIEATRLARSIRREQVRAKTEQYKLPGMEHMPVRIFDRNGKRRNLLHATYRDVREYVKRIGGGYDQRKRNDPKFKEAMALLKKMRAAAKEIRGVTVGEVLGPSR